MLSVYVHPNQRTEDRDVAINTTVGARYPTQPWAIIRGHLQFSDPSSKLPFAFSPSQVAEELKFGKLKTQLAMVTAPFMSEHVRRRRL